MTRTSFFVRLFAGVTAIFGGSLLKPFMRRKAPPKAPSVTIHPLAVSRSSQHRQTHA
jgi:hypothetical protein